ncbi:MAG: hypothetical protein SWC40_07045 [Thermodesulfobacteriota bacterium]|nr:hypothetical protein [Thermodesulfobacteriota bacterium]
MIEVITDPDFDEVCAQDPAAAPESLTVLGAVARVFLRGQEEES